jgi:quinolinate synthase
MAHMTDFAKIKKTKAEYDDLAVVCYINSTAEIKAHSDVCVTSSNAFENCLETAAEKHSVYPR